MAVVTSSTGIYFVPATVESEDVIIDFVANVLGVSSLQVNEIEIHETHVRFRWVNPEGEGTVTTVFVPWNNIKSIKQVTS